MSLILVRTEPSLSLLKGTIQALGVQLFPSVVVVEWVGNSGVLILNLQPLLFEEHLTGMIVPEVLHLMGSPMFGLCGSLR